MVQCTVSALARALLGLCTGLAGGNENLAERHSRRNSSTKGTRGTRAWRGTPKQLREQELTIQAVAETAEEIFGTGT
ncbi:hypothetical protein AOLI_G00008320 [Acnodon oligacanthus]